MSLSPGSWKNRQNIYTTRGFSFVWIEIEKRDGGRLSREWSGKRGKPRGQGKDEGKEGKRREDDDAYLI